MQSSSDSPQEKQFANITLEEVTAYIDKSLMEIAGLRLQDLTDDVTVANCGSDSLDNIEFVIAFEDEYGIEIPDEQVEKLLPMKKAQAIKALYELANGNSI